MTNNPFKKESMSRDELKQILFDWMKEKGVLGELQSFLRTKMVEKLRGTDLTPSENNLLIPREIAVNLIVCDYLKQKKLHYTLSVFASECNSVQTTSRLNSTNTKKEIFEFLEIKNLFENNVFSIDENNSVLEGLVKALEVFSSKGYKNKSSQIGDSLIGAKTLGLNAQSQTEYTHSITQSAQTIPVISSVKTQTEQQCCILLEEVDKQKTSAEPNQLNSSLKLPKQDFELKNNEKGKRYSSSIPNAYQKHITEALLFLSDLDGRLRYLDLKHENIVHQKDEVIFAT